MLDPVDGLRLLVEDAARAVSLHLYAPPLRQMEVYEELTGTSHPRRSGRRDPKSSVSAR